MAETSDLHPTTKLFGWNGLTCTMPTDWDVASVSGSQANGYFAFDDEQDRRLEIKYERAKRWRKPDVGRTLSGYFDTLRKKGKTKGNITVDANARVAGVETMPAEYDIRAYGWETDAVMRGLIWHCGTCDRIVIAECRSRKNRVSQRDMGRVLTSIRCHNEGPIIPWAVFDLQIGIPSDLTLESSRLQAGLISLTFSGKKQRVVVDRLGMGKAVVKHSSLDSYVRDVHYKKLRKLRLRFHSDEWQGNLGFVMEGEQRRFYDWLPAVADRIRSWRTGDNIGGRVWFDEPMNRIYVIRAEGRECQRLADAVAASVRCQLPPVA